MKKLIRVVCLSLLLIPCASFFSMSDENLNAEEQPQNEATNPYSESQPGPIFINKP